MAINALSSSYLNSMYGNIYSPYNSGYLQQSSALSMLSSLNNLGSVKSISSIYNINDLNAKMSSSLSELSDLLTNGFKVNSSSTSDNALSYLTTIKTASQNLKTSLSSLMGTSRNSAFNTLSPVSSDTKKLTLDTSGAKPGAGVSDMSINIDQLASGQVNKGAALTANANAGGFAMYEFSIESGDKTHQFTVVATDQDTNKTLQDKIAAAINAKGIGINATVEHNTQNNTSTLSIQTKDTGSGAAFSIQDLYGDAIGATGASTVLQQAQDAIYRVNNGEQQTSKSNTIDLGGGIMATMKEASADTIEVSMKADGSAALGALNTLVNSYNDLVTAAKGSGSDKALQLNYQLARTFNTYSTSLARLGITMDSGGKLSLNEDKVKTAAETKELQQFFSQDRYSNYGFANRLYNLASDINSNPMKYTDLTSLGLFNYNNNPYSPAQMMRYNQAYSAGLFVNMFV